MTAALVGGLALVVALLGVLVVGLLRSHAEILRALHELGVGLDPDGTHAHPDAAMAVPPPPLDGVEAVGRDLDIVGVTVDGAPRQVGVAGGSRRTLVAFLSSSCLTCRTFWDEFSDPELVVPAGARLVIVTKGPEAESPSAISELAPPHHLPRALVGGLGRLPRARCAVLRRRRRVHRSRHRPGLGAHLATRDRAVAPSHRRHRCRP